VERFFAAPTQDNSELENRIVENSQFQSLIQTSSLYWSMFNCSENKIAIYRIVQDVTGNPEDLEYIFVNPAYEREFGVEAKKIAGMKNTEVHAATQKYREKWLQFLKKAWFEKKACRFEHDFYDNGVWYETLMYYLEDQERLVTVSTNITRFKHTEMNLMRSENRWQTAFTSVGQGVLQWNIEKDETYYSHWYKEHFGFDSAENGQSFSGWLNKIHPEDLNRVKQAFWAHRMNKTNRYEAEYRLVSKNGEYRWILAKGKIIDNGNHFGNLEYIGIHTDITDLKRVEQALAESETRYRTLYENLTDTVFVMKVVVEGILEFYEVNEVACQILGYSREELLSMSPLEVCSEEFVKVYQDIINKLITENKHMFEADLITKTGETIPMEFRARHFIQDGMSYFISVARDLTERRCIDRLVLKEKRRAEQNQILNEFISGNQNRKEAVEKMLTASGIIQGNLLCCYVMMVKAASTEELPGCIEGKRPIQDLIIDELEKTSGNFVWVSKEKIGILHSVPSRKRSFRSYQEETGKAFLKQVSKRFPDIDVTIGATEPFANSSELGMRFRQCIDAVNISGKLWPESKIHYFQDLGFFQILSGVGDWQIIHHYIERTLGKLINYDNKKNAEYLKTLELILESANLVEAAQKAFIHHKTVLLRKKKIEDVLGVSLDNPDDRMNLAFALKLKKLQSLKEER